MGRLAKSLVVVIALVFFICLGFLISPNFTGFLIYNTYGNGYVATGKTTAEMKTLSIFTLSGWDFVEVWGIGENQTYPYLRNETAGDLNHDKKVDFEDFAILASHWLEGTGP